MYKAESRAKPSLELVLALGRCVQGNQLEYGLKRSTVQEGPALRHLHFASWYSQASLASAGRHLRDQRKRPNGASEGAFLSGAFTLTWRPMEQYNPTPQKARFSLIIFLG